MANMNKSKQKKRVKMHFYELCYYAIYIVITNLVFFNMVVLDRNL